MSEAKIWNFGAKTPTEGLPWVAEQIQRMHRYRNDLVRSECTRRLAAENTLRRLRPGLLEMEATVERLATEVETARAAIKEVNSTARKRRAAAAEREAVRELTASLRAARTELKNARKEAFAAIDVKEALRAVEEEDHARRIRLRSDSGLYWGNYLSIEQAAESFRKGPPPAYQPWRRGEGRVVVQIQKGMTYAELLGCKDTRLQLHIERTRGDGRKVGTVWFRVGTVEGRRTPIWTKVPVVIHRDLPEDALIKWAYLAVKQEHGDHWRWDLQLVVSRPSWGIPDASFEGTVGIDLGWRFLPAEKDHEDLRRRTDCLRVGAWVGSDGERGEFLIEQKDLERWSHVENLRSTGDEAFNEARDWFVGWLATATDIPGWLRRETVHLHQWRSRRRLRELVDRWAENRFPGDEEAFLRMDGVREGSRYKGWRNQDRHLYCWERANHEKAIAWRDNFYREQIAHLRRRYKTASIEDIDWRRLTVLPEAEEDAPLMRCSRRHRFIAAPGRLSELIHEGFLECVEVPAEMTTQRCCFCKKIDGFDAAKELVRKCRHCGRTEDQDWRAAINLRDGASAVVVTE